MDRKTKILILGGYGNTGFLIAKLLARETDAELVIAGRNLQKAEQTAGELNLAYSTSRVSAKQIDASNSNSLLSAFWDIDLVVVASSTMEYVEQVASAAIDAETDYVDIQLSSPQKLSVLQSLKKRIESNERCFITDGGFHPGVPAALVRYAASKFDEMEAANIWGSFQVNWKGLKFSDSTINEFINELRDFNPLVFQDGKWIKMSYKHFPKYDFGKPFGIRYCSPMYLEELISLPGQIKGLREAGFYIAGFNWMTDYIIMPLAFAGFKILGDKAKKSLGRLFYWSLANFSKPPYHSVLQIVASGQVNHQLKSFSMRLSHDDAYALTAIPVVACLLQYLNGDLRKPGLWLQGNVVKPVQFFYDVGRLGVKVSLN